MVVCLVQVMQHVCYCKLNGNFVCVFAFPGFTIVDGDDFLLSVPLHYLQIREALIIYTANYLTCLIVRFVSLVTNIKLHPNCQNTCFQERN